MTKETLLIFIKRLLDAKSYKSRVSLHQLEDILRLQDADPSMITLVKETAESVPEAAEAADRPDFSEEQLKIAIQRAADRRRREEENARNGRC